MCGRFLESISVLTCSKWRNLQNHPSLKHSATGWYNLKISKSYLFNLLDNLLHIYAIFHWQEQYSKFKPVAQTETHVLRRLDNPLISYYFMFMAVLTCKTSNFLYPPLNESWRGVYWFHVIRPSVCGQNRVRSVTSTILAGSISYLHILSSTFRRCVAYKVCCKIPNFECLANFWIL